MQLLRPHLCVRVRLWNACECELIACASTWISYLSEERKEHFVYILFSHHPNSNQKNTHTVAEKTIVFLIFLSQFTYNLFNMDKNLSIRLLHTHFLVFLLSFELFEVTFHATCSNFLIWDTSNDLQREENESSFNQRMKTTTIGGCNDWFRNYKLI